jgi:hypothetical protein
MGNKKKKNQKSTILHAFKQLSMLAHLDKPREFTAVTITPLDCVLA